MPRVRANGAKQSTTATATYESPVKTAQIPLNDDRAEKAQRLQSRQALHSKHMEQYKAAASPARKRRSLGTDGPLTPSQHDDAGYGVVGNAVTPMKRVPILANFEEWMKMATDNKINATNSWNFALIDYFHDMSLLKEGDGVNFQKASCTLDGCVKIYTSRVDSVATETGKLLSGLAESKSDKKRRGNAEAEDAEDEDEEGEDGEEGGVKKKSKKKAQRSAEATLVSDFNQLRLKKMELEFSVDPLFKKASADFDEGGAKGLLLNHLSIDGEGRIVFDSSDDTQEQPVDESRRDSMDPEGVEDEEKKHPEEPSPEDDKPVDLAVLGARFFPNLAKLDRQDICPSMKTFELGSGDTALDLPFLKAPDNWGEDQSGNPNQEGSDDTMSADNNFGIDNDDDVGFDLPPETGFGEGGEAWARDAALQPQLRVHDVYNSAEGGDEGGEVGTFDTNSASYGVTLQHRGGDDQENILNYFDAALHKNWAGPEHWKIARIKEANRSAQQDKEKRAKKEKEPFEIDFAAPMSAELANMLYTNAASNAAISLPRREWRSKTRNLLPDDKHFNSKDLLKLFLKPKARLGARKATGSRREAVPADGEVDEAYWATANGAVSANDDADAVQGDYDANFFQDDALPLPGGVGEDDDDEFADARERFSPGIADDVDAAGPMGPGIDAVAGSEEPGEGGFGANLIAQSRRFRPEYVQYARVAKKVDVRRLKENMWVGIGFDGKEGESAPPKPNIASSFADPTVISTTRTNTRPATSTHSRAR